MRRFSTSIALALSTLLLVSVTSAQQTAATSQPTVTSAQQPSTTAVPYLIRYSGTLKDAQGTASVPSTTIGVTFAIYKQQDGGAAVWQETQNVTPDASGQYSVILGSTTAAGLPDDLFSQQEQRWLGIQVQGEAEQPRVLLVSVPYAFKAHDAETLGGLPASAFIKAPLSSIAGSASTDASTAVSALGNAGNSGGTSKGRGKDGKLPPNGCLETSGYITYWDANGALCPSMLFQVIGGSNNGYIGIGTLFPSTALDVNGIINARKWYDIGLGELAFAGFGFNNLPSKRDTFVGVGAGTTIPANPPLTPAGETDNTFIGYYAGTTTTGTGISNTFIGSQAGFTNVTGTLNTFTGYRAGLFNTGNNNSCYGADSCLHNTSGTQNVCVGDAACFRNDTGSANTYVGFGAAFTNGGNINNNTFTGWHSGFNNSGSNNSFYGYQAGFNNTADGNSFYGYQAGLANLTGNQNAFFGNAAGISNATGHANTFSGNGAGFQHIDGDQNTFSGTSAGFNDYHGKANTFIGASAGQDNDGPGHVSGNQNTAVGVGAGLLAFGSHNTFTGYGAGSGVLNQSNGNYNTFTGESAGGNNTTGSYNTSYGYLAGLGNATGNSNVYLANSGANESNTIRIGMKGVGNQQQNMVFFDPILLYPTSSPYPDVVTIDNPSGKLGHAPYPTGGGVMGNCPSGVNYITKWLTNTPPTVQCSSIYENAGSAVGPQVGIGTTTFKTTNPAKLEVQYTDTTSAYPSVLRLHNPGPLNVFTQTGILFSTINDYDTARIYATLDCNNAGTCERISLQTAFPGGHYLDTLNVKNGTVGIGTINPAATLDVNGTVRVQNLPAGGNGPHVCFNANNILTACTPPAGDEIKTLQDQIQSLQKQNEDLQQRLSRLEALVEKK